MSGFPVKPPTTDSGFYNPSFFTAETDYLTLATAESAFAKLNDSRFNNLGFITSVTAGTAAASKALILDSNRAASNIGQLSLFNNTLNQSAGSMASEYSLTIQCSTTTAGHRAGIAFMATTIPSGIVCKERTGTNGIGDFVFAMRASESDSLLSNIMRINNLGCVKVNDSNQGLGNGIELEVNGSIRNNVVNCAP